jgi:hypothetical protein
MITKPSRIVAAGAFAVVAATAGLTALHTSGPQASALDNAVELSPSVVHAGQVQAASHALATAATPAEAHKPKPKPKPAYVPPPAPDPGTARSIAYSLLPSFGFDQAGQYTCLVALWTQESSWESWATEPTSGAYGLAQALGHGTAGTQGTVTNEYGGFGLTDAEAREANSGDATQQIRWGLGYIESAYGSPCAAEQHELDFRNY